MGVLRFNGCSLHKFSLAANSVRSNGDSWQRIYLARDCDLSPLLSEKRALRAELEFSFRSDSRHRCLRYDKASGAAKTAKVSSRRSAHDWPRSVFIPFWTFIQVISYKKWWASAVFFTGSFENTVK